MRCPFCDMAETKVIEERKRSRDGAIRRRRRCPQCHQRFLTFENVKSIPDAELKNDGTHQPLTRAEIQKKLSMAFDWPGGYLPPVPLAQLEEWTQQIIDHLTQQGTSQVSTMQLDAMIQDIVRQY